ncbi:hypothetical protein D3C71_1361490 [compost metagenome]
MIERDEYLAATNKISYEMIDVLNKWLQNEMANLNSYIENPEGHIMYNKFISPDMQAVSSRLDMLDRSINALTHISMYKKGSEDSTRVLHDLGFDTITAIIFERLLEWMDNRLDSLVSDYQKQKMGVPMSEYSQLATFNGVLFQETLKMYSDSIQGVKTVIEYKKQQITYDHVD